MFLLLTWKARQEALDLVGKKCISKFRDLSIALDITDKTRQGELLLHYAGAAVNDILDAEEGQGPLEKAILALTNYFEPKKNPAFEEYQLKQATENAITS